MWNLFRLQRDFKHILIIKPTEPGSPTFIAFVILASLILLNRSGRLSVPQGLVGLPKIRLILYQCNIIIIEPFKFFCCILGFGWRSYFIYAGQRIERRYLVIFLFGVFLFFFVEHFVKEIIEIIFALS